MMAAPLQPSKGGDRPSLASIVATDNNDALADSKPRSSSQMVSSVRVSSTAHQTETDSIKVAVRVRPFDEREKVATQVPCLNMSPQSNQVILQGGGGHGSSFQFDKVFWSVEGFPDADGGVAAAQQLDVYRALGLPLVYHAYNGFNSCLFAYGQTGSGKTHTMMGGARETDGVTPRICSDIFGERQRILESSNGKSIWSVQIGFIEIYNERVSDLLAERNTDVKGRTLNEGVYVNVRENPKTGVFLEGQAMKPVTSYDEIMRLLVQGNAQRHVAATKMNRRSNRSHAIVQLLLKEERLIQTGGTQEIKAQGKSSRMNLVDLAGSERVSQSGVEGVEFEQATFINLSLTTLGRVIGMLSDMAKSPNSIRKPPFRESKLTFLLRDSLGGNSKTFMIATVSPSVLNMEESISTLRYASRARDVVNTASQNEDPAARRIRELEEQMEQMRRQMKDGGDPAYDAEIVRRLALLQQDAERRAADLATLDLERQRAENAQKMLSASESEKKTLQSERDALERQVEDRKAEAQRAANELERLRHEQRKREDELKETIAANHLAMERMKQDLSGLEEGKQRLEATVKELDSERRSKDEAMAKLAEHKRHVEKMIADLTGEAAKREELQKQNDALATQMKDLAKEQQAMMRLARTVSELEVRVVAAADTTRRHEKALHESDEYQQRAALLVAASDHMLHIFLHALVSVKQVMDAAIAAEVNDGERRICDLQATVNDLAETLKQQVQLTGDAEAAATSARKEMEEAAATHGTMLAAARQDLEATKREAEALKKSLNEETNRRGREVAVDLIAERAVHVATSAAADALAAQLKEACNRMAADLAAERAAHAATKSAADAHVANVKAYCARIAADLVAERADHAATKGAADTLTADLKAACNSLAADLAGERIAHAATKFVAGAHAANVKAYCASLTADLVAERGALDQRLSVQTALTPQTCAPPPLVQPSPVVQPTRLVERPVAPACLAERCDAAVAPIATGARAPLSDEEIVQVFRRAGWDDTRISVLIGYSGWNGGRDVGRFLEGRSQDLRGRQQALRRAYQQLIGAIPQPRHHDPDNDEGEEEEEDDDEDF